MSDLWLDSVLAVPAIGIQIVVPPSVMLRLRDVIAPVLDKLSELTLKDAPKTRQQFQVEQIQTPTGPELRISKDGYIHKFVQIEGACHVVVEFSYALVESRAVGTSIDALRSAALFKDRRRAF